MGYCSFQCAHRTLLILVRNFFFFIQKELSAELALRTKAERNKQDEVRSSNVIPTSGGSSRRRPPHSGNSIRPTPSGHSSSRSRQRAKKEKLLCICQTPYDDTK